MRDIFADALNSSSGRLAEVLLKRITKGPEHELSDDVRVRLDTLLNTPAQAGRLARVRIAADVGFLFDRVPTWTTEKLIPLFDWSSPEASDLWTARKYSKYIGSPGLVGLTKAPFLEMFGRTDLPVEDLRTFASWMTAILISNQNGAKYPLAPAESRAALRRAGVSVLTSVGHRLAIEMERAKPEQKKAQWQKVVGPVFQALWPLDIELQTHATTFKLVQLLLATGEAFPDAVDAVAPFIRPEEHNKNTSVFSISNAPDVLYTAAPDKMLDLVVATVGDAPAGSVYALNKVLARLRTAAPQLANTRTFQKLTVSASVS